MQTTLNTQAFALLADCKHKLQLYRDASNGQYLGGVEYTKLIQRIDECRAALASPVSTGIAGDIPAWQERVTKAWLAHWTTQGYNASELAMMAEIADLRAILAAVPAQPTQPQPECQWPNCMSEKAQQDLAAEVALETFGVAAQPQQVEGAAPTDSTGSIRPSAEPAGQRDAPYQVTIGGNGLFAGLKVNVDPSLPLDTIELRGANRVRLNLKTGQQTILPAGTAGCPLSPNESTLSPEPAKVGGAGELVCWSCNLYYTAEQRADADGNCPNCGVEIELEDFAAKSSGVQAADLAGLKLWQAIEIRDDFPVRHETFYRAADVEALFNPTKESK